MLLWKCEVYDSKKSKFIKEQEASGLLGSLKIKTTLSKIPLVYDSKKSKFIKEQEANGLLSSLKIKTPLSKIPLVGPLLF